MHVGRHTTAQSAEIHSFGVHLSTWLTVGKERARIFFPRYGVAHGCAQEPTPGSAVKFRGKSVRKNRPLVPRSNIAGSWTRGGGGYLFWPQISVAVERDFPHLICFLYLSPLLPLPWRSGVPYGCAHGCSAQHCFAVCLVAYGHRHSATSHPPQHAHQHTRPYHTHTPLIMLTAAASSEPGLQPVLICNNNMTWYCLHSAYPPSFAQYSPLHSNRGWGGGSREPSLSGLQICAEVWILSFSGAFAGWPWLYDRCIAVHVRFLASKALHYTLYHAEHFSFS